MSGREEKGGGGERVGVGFAIMAVALVLISGLAWNTHGTVTADAQARRIVADMNNLRASAYAYYQDTDSWPLSLADIEHQADSPINIDTAGLSIVNLGGVLFVRYNGSETAAIPVAGNKVARALEKLRDRDMLYSQPTPNPDAAPNYSGGTHVYMLIKKSEPKLNAHRF